MSEEQVRERLPWEVERDAASRLEAEGHAKEAIARWCNALEVAFDAQVEDSLRALIVERVSKYYQASFPSGMGLLGHWGHLGSLLIARRRLSELDPRALALYRDAARRERPLLAVLLTWMGSVIPALACTFMYVSDKTLRPQSWGWFIYAGLVAVAAVSSLLLARWGLAAYRSGRVER